MSLNRPGYCNLCEINVISKDGLCHACITKEKQGNRESCWVKIDGKPF